MYRLEDIEENVFCKLATPTRTYTQGISRIEIACVHSCGKKVLGSLAKLNSTILVWLN